MVAVQVSPGGEAAVITVIGFAAMMSTSDIPGQTGMKVGIGLGLDRMSRGDRYI